MTTGPWGARDGTIGAPPPRTVQGGRPPSSAGGGVLWNLVSTLLLAGFLAVSMGPIFAVAGVVGVLVHEVGHVAAMNMLGCGPARIVIIPFLGGAAVPARPAQSEFRDVIISLAGPVFGLLAMSPFFVAYAVTSDPQWFDGAFFVAFINLLNLAPAPPLDGSKAIGPALARIHPLVERTAMAVVGAAAVWWAFSRGSWLLAAFLGIGLLGSLKSGRTRPPGRPLEGMEFLWSILLYAAAAALCVLALAVALNGMGRPISPQAVLEVFR